MSEEKKVKIRPYARLITMLGEQLIKNERIALIELIKNSYDADADWVKITFEGFGENYEVFPDSKIIIEDNGEGMSQKIIELHWLNPATPWIGKEGWVGDTPLDIKHKRTKGILRYVLEPDCRLRFICNSSLWAFFQPIMEEEYRACRSLEELKSIMGRKIMRKTANGTVIKTIDEVSIENGKCYINQSTALNLFLKWVFEDTGKPVGVKNDEYFTHTNPYDFAKEYFEDSDAEEVKIVAYKRLRVIPERFIDTVLEYVLELLDEEFSNTAQEYTSASGCMIKDTKRYLKRIARHYTPHDCEPIGEFIIKRNEVKQ